MVLDDDYDVKCNVNESCDTNIIVLKNKYTYITLQTKFTLNTPNPYYQNTPPS